MIYEELFDQALIKPCAEGADNLKIISGYATSAMAFHHLEHINDLGGNLNISLLVGMCPSDGLSISNHRGFQEIMDVTFPNKFSCSYIFEAPPVHSKIYIWLKGDKLYKSFIGSANYTQMAFSSRQKEVLAEIKDTNVLSYFNTLERKSIFCNLQETENLVNIYNDKHYYRKHAHEEIEQNAGDINNGIIFDNTNFEMVTVSLLGRNGEVQKKAGLNWGQRAGRDKNQAYIQLSPVVYRSDFFPVRAVTFTVQTDDGKTIICTRAQKDDVGQAIETPQKNSLIGEYFRNRLGLANGAFITREHLESYGRTDVTFYKFDNENYYMDFSTRER